MVRLLGDGQRHHPYGRVGEQRHHGVRVAGGVPHTAERAHHPGGAAGGGEGADAEQVVLRGERLDQGGAARGDRDDAPVPAGRADRRLGIDGLVGPVERAEPEVHHAGRDGARPDQWAGLGGQPAQRAQAEPGGADGHRHAGPSGKRNSAIDAGFMVAL
ncbi:hypothetical protein GCM10027614_13160 [Micromonospora vulcania]